MNIRKLTVGDIGSFREIRVEMCQLHPEAFNQTPEEVMAMADDKLLEIMALSEVFPEKFILGYFENDRILGTVGFLREDSVKEKHRGWIWAVYVRSDGRGKGISKQLMKQVIDESCRMEGLEILELTVSVTQTSARTLYTSLGFITTGLMLSAYKLPDGRYIDDEFMALKL